MAGLLDFLNTDEGRLGLGLLAAAGPRSDGMGMGGRIQEAYAGADARKRAQAEDEWKKMQMEEARQQMAQRAQAQEQARQAGIEAQRVRGLVANAGRGATDAVESAMPQGMGIPGQQAQPINFQALMQQGVPFELVKQLADSQNLGRQEVARTADIEGPGGSKQVQGFDKYGNPVGRAANGYVAPQLINRGDRQEFAKPQAGASFPMGMSPSERDASARGWAGNSLARERLNFDKAGGADGQKAPAGYRWKGDGSMEAIPGGPAAGNKLTESEGKSTLYLSQMREATKALEGVGDKVSPMMIAATGSPLTNWMAGDNPQKAGQAQRQWAEAYLREKTGAAATAGEVENNIKTFFPVVGDSAAVIAQKKTARADAEKAMEIPAGRGTARLGGASGGWDDKPKPLQAPREAINMLKMNPKLAAAYDEKYGAGAAAQVLGR